jgi:GrpB-like predicted nucleotidyltransferase (UPF0157 family)
LSVTLVEKYNSQWTLWFGAIIESLGWDILNTCLRIEHVGSTSVPGITAKPIIDIILVIKRSDFEAIKDLLEIKGYKHVGDQGIYDRQVFKITDEQLRKALPQHHLYVCPDDSEELKREVAFRDYLKTHREDAGRLSELKWLLAENFNNDRDAYMKGKAALCREITEKAFANQ